MNSQHFEKMNSEELTKYINDNLMYNDEIYINDTIFYIYEKKKDEIIYKNNVYQVLKRNGDDNLNKIYDILYPSQQSTTHKVEYSDGQTKTRVEEKNQVSYYTICKKTDFIEKIENNIKYKNKQIYESYNNKQKVNFFADIEYYTKDDFDDYFLKEFKRVLDEDFDYEIYVLEASRFKETAKGNYKNSYHLHIKGSVFGSNKKIKYYLNDILRKKLNLDNLYEHYKDKIIVNLEKDNKTNDETYENKRKEMIISIINSWIDLSVYSKTRSFRTISSLGNKKEKEAILKRLKIGTKRPDITKYLITDIIKEECDISKNIKNEDIEKTKTKQKQEK